MMHKIDGPIHRFERPFRPMVRLFGALFIGSTLTFLPVIMLAGAIESPLEQFMVTFILVASIIAGGYLVLGSEVATINRTTREVMGRFHVKGFDLPTKRRGTARLIGEIRVHRETMHHAGHAHRVSHRWVVMIPMEDSHRNIRFLHFPDPDAADDAAGLVARVLGLEFDPGKTTR